MASLLRAQNPPTFLFQINSAAVPGAIFYPNFVALDSSNNVYAPDTDNNRVVKLAGNGSYLTQWGTYPNPCSRD
jgi:DNA-binding beta-propeller fold protein YncE